MYLVRLTLHAGPKNLASYALHFVRLYDRWLPETLATKIQ